MNLAKVSFMVVALSSLRFIEVQAQTSFSKLSASTDSSYGYKPTNPIKLKKGEMGRSIANSVAYLSGLRTTDNQTLQKVARLTVRDPAYTKPAIQLTNRYTGMPVSGKLGLLDKYIFLTSATKDTVVLYVDIYNKGQLALPKGLRYEEGLQ